MWHRFSIIVALGSALLATPAAYAQGTLRVAMTSSDIPLTAGQPDNGAEGFRFIGYTLYDALVNWDMSSATKPASITPGLATEWKVDDSDKTKWRITLRDGVKFHDGSDFNADAVVWNFDKILKQNAPQYDPKQAAQGRSRINTIASYKALDKRSIEIVTAEPDAALPYALTFILMSSPANWEKQGRNWDRVLAAPSGTGPWKLDKLVPRERAELVKNPNYWDKNRIPKLDRLVLLPMPEANTRTAALRSGQVDWIEAPAPDAIPSIKQAGFHITQNVYPHNWTWHLSRVEGSPWNDVRVRKAANLAIDREGIVKLLGGYAIPAKGFVSPTHPWFGNPGFALKYDPEQAKKLMEQAGYSPQKPLAVKVLISPAGSGQMLPLPMNELLQQNLNAVGFKIDFEVADWTTLTTLWRAGAKAPGSRGVSALNSAYYGQDPFTAFERHMSSKQLPPAGTNWGYFSDPKLDEMFAKVRSTFDPAAQARLLQQIHERFVDEALFLMVTHDVGPRAMSPKVKGFVQAQNWYQDLSSVSVSK